MTTISFRTDPAIDAAIDLLAEEAGSRSEAIRAAILDAGRQLRRARMQAEALSVANDPDEQVEIAAARADLESHRAW